MSFDIRISSFVIIIRVIMFDPKIKIERNLYETLKRAAQAAGYSSVDEFIIHVLEKTAAEVEQAQSEDEVRKRLQGLGYIE